MSDASKKPSPLHVESQTENPADGTKNLCDSAPDKEKCEAFVERLAEASANIKPKQG
ncbi:MAG: hypothetical protein ABJZ55_00775 [Fuerstiella sp.]